MSDYVLTEAQRNEINQKLATQHAEIATLRSDLAKAREEIKRWEDKEVNRAVNCCGQEERALLAERARDEAVAEVARLKEALESHVRDWRRASAIRRGVDSPDDVTFNGQQQYARALDACAHAVERALGRTDGEG